MLKREARTLQTWLVEEREKQSRLGLDFSDRRIVSRVTGIVAWKVFRKERICTSRPKPHGGLRFSRALERGNIEEASFSIVQAGQKVQTAVDALPDNNSSDQPSTSQFSLLLSSSPSESCVSARQRIPIRI